MALPLIPIIGLAGQLIDKLIPDPVKAAEAKAELVKLEQQGDLKELEISMSAIVMEAKSTDPWTSRARPSFLYVIYICILAAFPISLLSAFEPNLAATIAHGFKSWLEAIPEALWALFGAGYLGYAGARSYDKRKILEKEK